MTQSLIILGTGGNALDILDVIEAINTRAPAWIVAGFLDDVRPAGGEHLGLAILGRLCDAGRLPGHSFANAIGSDRSYQDRPRILASTGLTADRFATLVHPCSSVPPRSRLGLGTCVNFGACVGGGVVTGDHVTIGPGCIVGHDTVIEDYAVIAPGAVVSGGVRLGRNCYVGARSVIRQRLRVGERALVGMGAVVVRDVDAGETVVGNPARPHLPTARRFEEGLQ
jgi:sugar O-acyltransferase (sialic acid O-acetyltransferase NeuD family)